MNTSLKILLVIMWIAPVIGIVSAFLILFDRITFSITMTLFVIFLAGILVPIGYLLYLAALASWDFLIS